MACDTCSVPSILLEANHSIASTSSFQIVGSTTNERPKSAQQQQQKICNQTLQSSLMSLFDEPIISDDAIWIYKQSVPVACQGPYEPSDIDRLAYESYVASLMINVQS